MPQTGQPSGDRYPIDVRPSQPVDTHHGLTLTPVVSYVDRGTPDFDIPRYERSKHWVPFSRDTGRIREPDATDPGR